MEGYSSVFIDGSDEFLDLCREGDHSLWRELVSVFPFVCFLVCVVIVGGEEGCSVSCDYM